MLYGIFPFLLLLVALVPSPTVAQQQQLGTISGQVLMAKGDVPSRSVIVELRLRGATISSIYTDTRGQFSFSNLDPNAYHIVIQDDAFYGVDEPATIITENPTIVLHVVLHLREAGTKDPMPARASGGNRFLVDPADYNKRFPKKVIKEYERGIDAERRGKREDAISHYQEALKIAPDYYPAHNNLGTVYLSKTDFKSAEEQFREAVRLDQNEAQAYFNLANLYLLTKRYTDAEGELALGLQRRPDSAFGHFLEGALLARTARYAEAETNLREALRLDRAMWQAHLQIVSLYLEQNRRTDAINELEAFLKTSPSAPAAPNARELLRKLQSQTVAARP